MRMVTDAAATPISSFRRDITSVASCPAALDLNKAKTFNNNPDSSGAHKHQRRSQQAYRFREEEGNDEEASTISQLSFDTSAQTQQIPSISFTELRRRSYFGWIIFMCVLLHLLFLGTYFYIEIEQPPTPISSSGRNSDDTSSAENEAFMTGTINRIGGGRHNSRSLPSLSSVSLPAMYTYDDDQHIITPSLASSPFYKTEEEIPLSEFVMNVHRGGGTAPVATTKKNQVAYAENEAHQDHHSSSSSLVNATTNSSSSH
mmetsp:Transcript_17565/g.26045  ORF Transcript_17565/g.26045 Transcript_17565/m.26045 type:complete len:259 (-) Transcript_17565:286-1062(-)